MKDKIMLFIIGVLTGALISTGIFYVYTTTNNSNENNNKQQMPGGNPPGLSDGQNGGMEEPPEMPSGERPEMPNENGFQENNKTTSNQGR